MAIPLHALIAAVKTLNLFLGGLITYYAVKAYRRNPSTTMWAFSVGFGLITIGGAVAGFLDVLVQLGTLQAILVEAVFVAVGFVAILYSLFR